MAICIVVPTRNSYNTGGGRSSCNWPVEAIFINKEKNLKVKLLFWETRDFCKRKEHQGITFELQKWRYPDCDWVYLNGN